MAQGADARNCDVNMAVICRTFLPKMEDMGRQNLDKAPSFVYRRPVSNGCCFRMAKQQIR
jgi:hypothetical protein